MLVEIFPRAHARFTSLPLLGRHVEDFAVWLRSQGYPLLPLRLRIRETPRLDARLRRRGVRRLEYLSVAQLLECAPGDSQDDICRAAVVRSLARYLDARGVLARPVATPRDQMVAAYRAYLERVRGLADSTLTRRPPRDGLPRRAAPACARSRGAALGDAAPVFRRRLFYR